MQEAWQIFVLVFTAMLRVWLIILCGYFVFRFNLLTKVRIYRLSSLTINFFLPCYIFSHFLDNFTSSLPSLWYVYPVLGVFICLLGFIVGKIFTLFDKKADNSQEFISIVSFQNCGYLPLILVLSVFAQDIAKTLVTNIFLFIQGFNFIFWGFGVQLLKPKGNPLKIEFKKIFNAPFMALILSIFIIYSKHYALIPNKVIGLAHWVGILTLPLVLLILGAILAESFPFSIKNFSVKKNGDWRCEILALRNELMKVTIAKLVVVPFIVLIVIMLIKMPKIMALLLLLEACMPAAINLSVVSFYQNAKSDFVASAVFLTHLIGLLTIPFFMAIGRMLIGL